MPRSNHPFNPNSPDAMFATILARLDQQDETVDERHQENARVLKEILTQTTATNGRVTKLEQRWKYAIGWLAGACFVLTAIWEIFSRFF